MDNYSMNDYAAVWLSLPFNMSPRKRMEWLGKFDDAQNLYEEFGKDRQHFVELIGENNYLKLSECYSLDYIKSIIVAHNKKSVEIITIYDDRYPDSLRNLDDSPICLYCLGNIGLLAHTPSISVVGTRTATRYGKDVTKKLVAELAYNNFTIVSGMARGIDTIAHTAALDNNGKTVAVVGTGLDVVYPAENRELALRIANNGLIVSEYPFGVTAKSYNFPQRNRIISALGECVMVTEAGLKSGSTITADFALSLGKDVLAVPGSILSETSAGTNSLIQKGACMITGVNDIYKLYNIKEKQQKPSTIQLDFTEQSIVDFLIEDKHFDEILQKSNLTVESLMPILLNLELCGIIRKLPGNFYCKAV